MAAAAVTLVAVVAVGGASFAFVPRLLGSPEAGGAHELPATSSPSIVDSSETPAEAGVASTNQAGVAGSNQASAATRLPSTAAARPPTGPAPASHWPMNEKTGTTAYDSVAGHHAKFVGGVYWSAERGGAVAFNGTGTLITSGPVIDTSKSFTISAWAKILINQRWSVIAAQYGDRASGFLLGYNHVTRSWAFGMPQADVDDPDESDIDTASGAEIVQHDVFYHVVGVYDTSAARPIMLYVNGQLAATATHGMAWNATGPLVFGCGKYNGAADLDRIWRGSITNVHLYARALSASEVAQIP